MPLPLRLLFLVNPKLRALTPRASRRWGLAELHLPFVPIISCTSFLKNLTELFYLFKLMFWSLGSLPATFRRELLLPWFSPLLSILLSLLSLFSLRSRFYWLAPRPLESRDEDPWFGLTIITDLLLPVLFLQLCLDSLTWWFPIIQLLCKYLFSALVDSDCRPYILSVFVIGYCVDI